MSRGSWTPAKTVSGAPGTLTMNLLSSTKSLMQPSRLPVSKHAMRSSFIRLTSCLVAICCVVSLRMTPVGDMHMPPSCATR